MNSKDLTDLIAGSVGTLTGGISMVENIDLVVRIIGLIGTIISVLIVIFNIVLRVIKKVKKAKEDGVITKDELKYIGKEVTNGIGEVADGVNKIIDETKDLKKGDK